MVDDYTVNLNDLELRGIIPCPYCGKGKTYVYKETTGMVSNACNVCKRIVLWDFDHLSAYKAFAKKFAS